MPAIAHHILDAIREIEDFTSAGRGDFDSRRIVQAAVTRNLPTQPSADLTTERRERLQG